MNLTPTTFHQHMTHTTNQFKLPFITPTFQLTSSDYVFTQSGIFQLDFSDLLQLSGLQRPTSTELYACPSIASTSYLALTFPGKWLFVVNLGMVYWWLLSNENVLPDVFLPLSKLAVATLQPSSSTHRKTSQRVSPQNPKYANARCKMRERERKLLDKDWPQGHRTELVTQ